jgi:hypothetical protein
MNLPGITHNLGQVVQNHLYEHPAGQRYTST